MPDVTGELCVHSDPNAPDLQLQVRQFPMS